MSNKEKFSKLIVDSCDFISDTKLYKDVEEALIILDMLKGYLSVDYDEIICKLTEYEDKEVFKAVKDWLENDK